MGLSLKRLAKGALKIAGRVAKTALSTTPAGQAVLKAQQTLKGLGVSLRAARIKPQPLQVVSSVEKIVRGPARRLKAPSFAKRTALPGGAPIASGSRRKPRKPRDKALTPGDSKAPRRRRRPRDPNAPKRKPPVGGKDLKALSVAWKAAGKPGRWIDWVKAH